MEIRKAKPEDLDQLTQYGMNLLKQHSEFDTYFTPIEKADEIYRMFLEGCLNSENKVLLVAEKEGQLFGYAAGEIQTRSPVFKVAQNGYINDVFVEEEFRKLGIARKFLKTLKKWFESRHIEHIELSVLAKNEIGIKTWQKFGFEAYELKKRVAIENFDVE
ncbi:MAG TPA: GNAT family N-acetyltransferase [Flavobacteriaceae bacterium]|nr:GNAT family N-acetyltransferase [Flavobacteriaceae bacterium]